MKTLMTMVWAGSLMLGAPAFAQTATYETPGYMPRVPTVLDPNYGLPTFGMPDAELPQQRTMATERGLAEPLPVLDRPPPDFTVPTGQAARAGDVTPPAVPETPVYTTSETGTTGGDTTNGDDDR
jgi:hypothetical protein